MKCPHASSRNGSSGQQGLRKDGHESRHILHEHDLHRRLHRHHHRPHHPPGKRFEGRVWKTAENRASQSCWRLLRSDQVSRRAAPPFRFGLVTSLSSRSTKSSHYCVSFTSETCFHPTWFKPALSRWASRTTFTVIGSDDGVTVSFIAKAHLQPQYVCKGFIWCRSNTAMCYL